MQYWLFKTEPTSYSIDDLRKDKRTSWHGVRNYQARNMLRDAVKKGDQVIIYHSSCEVPGVYGVAQVVKEGYPDPTQFDPRSHYFDATANSEHPRWYVVDIAFKAKCKTPIPLADMRKEPMLSDMQLLAPGNRLSLFPISKRHWDFLIREKGKHLQK